jgi:uncharacterized protein (DUF1810 family)
MKRSPTRRQRQRPWLSRLVLRAARAAPATVVAHLERSAKAISVPGQNINPSELDRFITAQRESFDTALEDLRRGRKRSHWMWFIFPQVEGLGTSQMATRYAIRSRAEATAYLEHPVLGPRLQQCAKALLAIEDKTAEEVMGYPDWMKLKSSMTLFAEVAGPRSPFKEVLDRYFAGEHDTRTLEFLTRHHTK